MKAIDCVSELFIVRLVVSAESVVTCSLFIDRVKVGFSGVSVNFTMASLHSAEVWCNYIVSAESGGKYVTFLYLCNHKVMYRCDFRRPV